MKLAISPDNDSRQRRSCFWPVMLALLAGCSGGNDFSDLRQYIEEVAAEPERSGIQTAALNSSPTKPFKYGAANLRSPFQAPLVVASSRQTIAAARIESVHPPPDHVRGYLEEIESRDPAIGRVPRAPWGSITGSFAMAEGVRCTRSAWGLIWVPSGAGLRRVEETRVSGSWK